jgi:hypothetical protein
VGWKGKWDIEIGTNRGETLSGQSAMDKVSDGKEKVRIMNEYGKKQS